MAKLLISTLKAQLIILLIPVALVVLAILAKPTNSTPPEYKIFGRYQ